MNTPVMLSTKNIPIPTGISKKISPKYIGPFTRTEKLASVLSYCRDHPDEYKVHPVSHVSFLKPYREDVLSRGPPREVRFQPILL